jgi:2-iminobutanoate/2-iminopropanoate deaminase
MTGLPKVVGPYSLWVRSGEFVVTSGQIGLRDGESVGPDIESQTLQVFANLKIVLADAGLTLADVIKTTVFLTDMADYPKMNAIYAAEFGETRPARSAVGVAALPAGAIVEIEAWCHAPLS